MRRVMLRPTRLGMLVPLVVGCLILFVSARAVAAESTASIRDFAYAPAILQVNVGDTVTWTNHEDVMPHDVTSGMPGRPDVGHVFASEILLSGQSFSFTPTVAGEYPYLCKLHPAMTGVVIVAAQSYIAPESYNPPGSYIAPE